MTRRRSRRSSIGSGKLPKGAYRLPTGGYVLSDGPVVPASTGSRQLRVTGVVRDQIDVPRLAKSLLAIAEQMSRDGQDAER